VHEKRKASLLATSGGNGAAASCDCGAKNEADAADDDDGANAEVRPAPGLWRLLASEGRRSGPPLPRRTRSPTQAKTAKRHRSAGD